MEREVLLNLSHPNIIKLHYCFRDEEKLYLVLEEAANKDLFHMLCKLSKDCYSNCRNVAVPTGPVLYCGDSEHARIHARQRCDTQRS